MSNAELLAQWNAEKQIRRCMHQYMRLCDELGPGSDLDALMSLFAADATWEGLGKRYKKTFGRYVGCAAIRQMFAGYTREPGHFLMNIHFLGNEDIDVTDATATASWLLMQPSDITDGRSQLSCARLSVSFTYRHEQWLIQHFTTENIFSRPMASPWDNAAELPVPDKND
jgi:hypothetical protein